MRRLRPQDKIQEGSRECKSEGCQAEAERVALLDSIVPPEPVLPVLERCAAIAAGNPAETATGTVS